MIVKRKVVSKCSRYILVYKIGSDLETMLQSHTLCSTYFTHPNSTSPQQMYAATIYYTFSTRPTPAANAASAYELDCWRLENCCFLWYLRISVSQARCVHTALTIAQSANVLIAQSFIVVISFHCLYLDTIRTWIELFGFSQQKDGE